MITNRLISYSLFVTLYFGYVKANNISLTCKAGDSQCLLTRVTKRSNDGKMIFNRRAELYQVRVVFTLLSIDDLSNDGVLRTRLRVKLEWTDEDLKWDAKKMQNEEDLIVMPSDAARWPKFVMMYDQDEERSFIQKMADFPVVITSQGINSITGEVTTATSCNMQVTSFPNDIQTCQIRLSPIPLGIRSLTNLSVTYIHNPDLFDDSVFWPLHPKFRQDSERSPIVADVWSNDELVYAFLQINLKRNGHDVNVALVMPMFTFSFVTAIIYWLPPDSGERIGSSITMVLTMAVSMLAVKDILPNADTSRYGDPCFSLFCQITFAQTMILFLESILVLVLWNGDSPYSVFYQVKRSRATYSSSSSSSLPTSSSSPPEASISSAMALSKTLRRSNSYSLEAKDDGESKVPEEPTGALEFLKKFAVKMDLVFSVLNLALSVAAVTWTIYNIHNPSVPRVRFEESLNS